MTIQLPHLVGKKILLRNPRPADYGQIKDVLNDRVTMEFLIAFFQTETWDDAMVKARYENFQKLQDEGKCLQFVVCDLASGKVVGSCGFKNLDAAESIAEFGIIVHRNYWGSGLTKECFLLSLDHAFGTMKLKTIYLKTAANNVRMQGFLKKIGMKLSQVLPDGALQYNLTQPEWPSVAKNLI